MTKEIIFKGKYLPKEFVNPLEDKVVYIKNDTGLGGTSLFLNDTEGLNLVITPNVSQIKSKEGRGYNSYFVYYKSEDAWDIDVFTKSPKNIYTTYKQLTLLQNRDPLLYSYLTIKYKLVVDEYHSILTKSYMGDMDKIVDHVERFKKVVMTSATETDVFINPVIKNIPKYRWRSEEMRVKEISIFHDYKKEDIINNVLRNIENREHTIIFSNNINVHAKYFEEESTENVVGSILKDKLIRYKDNINENFDYSKYVHVLSSKAYEGMDFLEDTHVLFLTENTSHSAHLSKKILEITQGYGRGRQEILSATLMIRKKSEVPVWSQEHIKLGEEQALTSFNFQNRHGQEIESLNKSYLSIESELYDDYSNHYLYNDPEGGLSREGFIVVNYKEPPKIYDDGKALNFLSKKGSLKYRIERYTKLDENIKLPLELMLKDVTVFGKGKYTSSYFEEALMGDMLTYFKLEDNFNKLEGTRASPKGIYDWFIKLSHYLGYHTTKLNTSKVVINNFLGEYDIPETLKDIDEVMQAKITMFVLLYYRKYVPKKVLTEEYVRGMIESKGNKYTKWEYKAAVRDFKNTLLYLAMGLSGNEERLQIKKKGGRFYSPLTNLPSEIRKLIPVQMYEIDLKKFNPTFLANEFKQNVKGSSFISKVPKIYLDNNTDKSGVNKTLNLHIGLYVKPNSDYSTVGAIDSDSANKYLDPKFIKFMKSKFMDIGMNNEEAAYFYKRYFIQKGRFFKYSTYKEMEIINKLSEIFNRPTYRLHDAMYAFVQGEITDIPEEIEGYQLTTKLYN